MIEKYGRKFFQCICILVAGTLLLLLNFLSGSEFLTLTLGTVGAFMTSNVVQDFVPTDRRGSHHG
jgi:hypothetical protein